MKAFLSHPQQHYNTSTVCETALKSEKWISEEQAGDVEEGMHCRLEGSTRREQE